MIAKLYSAVLVSIGGAFLCADALHPTTDIYFHTRKILGPSMWAFGPTGIHIFSADGSKVLKTIDGSTHCPEVTNGRTGEVSSDCNFYHVASDGHKYVWAAINAGTQRIEAFDIDTAEFAGYVPTCSTPMMLTYHPTREEMFVRCAQDAPDGGHEGEIDSFSVNSIGANYDQIKLDELVRPYGHQLLHSSLGNLGYATVYNSEFLYEMDLSMKNVAAKYEIPQAYGSYDITYSPFNRHLFLRARVCCTCGSPQADVETCSRASNVTVTTGPSAGPGLQLGMCSGGCEGTVADTIGVWEFDTVSKSFVASHNIKEGTGFGANPVSSPDGRYVLLLGNDGGQNLRILKPNGNGEESSVMADVAVNFQGGTPGVIAIDDFAFVQKSGKTILVVGSNHDNDIALIDLSQSPPTMRKLSLTSGELTAGSTRQIEWVVDTNYVWVTGQATEELYVIDLGNSMNIQDATVVKTIAGFSSQDIRYVENYERRARMAEFATSDASSGSATDDSQGDSSGTGTRSSASSEAMANDDDDNDIDPVGVAALVIASVACILSLFSVFLLVTRGNAASAAARGKAAGGDHGEEQSRAADTPTLGSKQVA